MRPSATSDLPADVIDAFVASTVAALRELVQQEAILDDSSWPEVQGESIVAVIRLLRNEPGKFAIMLDPSSALRLAEGYLPAGSELSDAMVNDVVGEFANVIAGQAKTILKGTPYHFRLSIPMVSQRNDPLLYTENPKCTAVAILRFEESRLRLFLELSPCPGA